MLARPGVLAAAAALLLTACSGSGPQEPDAAPTPPDLAPFLEQSVGWQACPASDRFLDQIPDSAECATVEVPVDYSGAAGDRGTIEIALIRIPAQGASRGSLLLNPGGPGASGFDQVALSAESLQRNLPGYDIVGFDPRGVSRSAGLDCKQGTDRRLDDIEADLTPEDAEEFDLVFTAGEEYDAACRDAYPNWGFLGTSSVAQDIYVISRALGDTGINYFGVSYGSVIGYELLRRYPDDIDRMILESVVDPAVEDQFADQLEAFDAQLAELLVLCASPEHPSCGQGRSAEQVRSDFLEAAAAVEDPTNATLTDNGRPSESLVFWGMVLPLYLELDQELTDLYLDALGAMLNDRDVQQFEFWGYLYNSYDYGAGRFLATDDIQQLVLCLDESERPEDVDIAGERAKDEAELADIRQRAPLLAAVGFTDAYTADERAYQPCSYAELAYEDPAIPDPLPEAAEVVNPGGVPVLVLAVSGDTATPYDWSRSIAERLGVPLVTQDTTGHGVYASTESACTIGVVTTYLESGALPADPVTC